MEKIKIVVGRWVMIVGEWIRKNPKEFKILIFILLIGAFFRLYRISEYMTFLGDEGRDAIIVRRLLVDFDPILIGPGTSIGNMYLGPLYYYLMAPALLLANFSPVGPAIMIALLGVVTIFFVWYVARKWFRQDTVLHGGALVATFLYAISPVIITYSHSSWNPNIMPFFALLTIYSIWKVWICENHKWLIVCGVSFAFVLQSHYLGLLLAPVIGFFYVLTVIRFWSNKSSNAKQKILERRSFIKYSTIGLLVFLFLMSPLVIFDARHGWRNFEAIKIFFTQRQTTVNLKPWKGLTKIWPIFRDDFVTRIVVGKNVSVGKITSITLLVGTLILLVANYKKIIHLVFKNIIKKKDTNFVSGFLVLTAWLAIGLLGMGLYKQHVYDHYFGFLFPAIYLLIGVLFEKIYRKFGDGGKIFLVAGMALLVIANLKDNPLRYPPNRQMQRSVAVAEKIQEEAGGEKFNLAVIAERNYEDGYQYFLERNKAGVVDIDAQREETVMNQLFVVCELAKEKCDPTHSAKAEVANFGWSEIENQWEVMGVQVYKLVHPTNL